MKKDCFAYRKNVNEEICVALKYPMCDGCKFYKEKEQYRKELEKYPIETLNPKKYYGDF